MPRSRQATTLPRRYFEEPLRRGRDQSALDKDPRVFQAAQLADKGAYVEAAALALELLDDGSRDIRVMCHYMCGHFAERGIRALDDIVPRFVALLGNELQTVMPANKRAQVVDSALSRLFRIFAEAALFHAAKKDETWQAWLDSVDAATLARILDECKALQDVLSELVESSQGLLQVTRLARSLRESYLAVMTRRERAEASRVAEEEQARADQEAAAAEAAAEAASDRAATTGAAGSEAPLAPARPGTQHTVLGHEPSPALALLVRKLDAFERLLENGNTAKAAIVASDIRDTIANFDPIVYLPALFSSYFQLLSQSIDELTPYWHESDSPTWQALEQFYRTDLDRFVED